MNEMEEEASKVNKSFITKTALSVILLTNEHCMKINIFH
jgi:hypothetical protein